MYLIFDIATTQEKQILEAKEVYDREWPRLIQIAWTVFDQNYKHIDFQAYYIKPEQFTIANGSILSPRISQATLEQRGLPINIILNKIFDAFEQNEYWIAHDIDYNLDVIEYELLQEDFLMAEWVELAESKNILCTQNDDRVVKYFNKKLDPGSGRLPKLDELYYELFNEKLKVSFNAEIDVLSIAKCFWELVNRNCYNETENISSRNNFPIPDGLPELIPYRNGKKWGFCNSNKEILIKEIYDSVSEFKNNYALVLEGNGKRVLLDKNGKSTDLPGLDAHQILNKNHFIVKNADNIGVYNYKGEEIIKPVFQNIKLFFDGVIFAQHEKNKKYIVFDNYGNFLRDTNYHAIEFPSEGISQVSSVDKNLVGYLNLYGDEIISCKYNYGCDFKNGLAKVRNFNSGWGLINEFGKEIAPLIYESISDINNGLVIVKKDGKYGILSSTGKLITNCTYQIIEDFQDGLAKGINFYEYSYINSAGNIVIHLKGIQEADSFSDGMCRVKDRGKYGYMNKAGQIIINCKYDDGQKFSNGLACVRMHNKWGFVDKLGKEVAPNKYDKIYSFKDGLASVCIRAKWGIIDLNGNELIKCIYDSHFTFNLNKGPKYKLAIVQLNGKKGIIDYSGNAIVPCQYWGLSDGNWSTNTNNCLFMVIGKNSNFVGYIDKSGEEYFE